MNIFLQPRVLSKSITELPKKPAPPVTMTFLSCQKRISTPAFPKSLHFLIFQRKAELCRIPLQENSSLRSSYLLCCIGTEFSSSIGNFIISYAEINSSLTFEIRHYFFPSTPYNSCSTIFISASTIMWTNFLKSVFGFHLSIFLAFVLSPNK